ncbi:MAG: hypothetical protein IJ685_13975 [Selenomonadaceae bacterium]|nr:hypothetical protein [Selenomonadaceae bacterium]
MDKRTLIEKIKALAAAPTCHPDLKQAAKAYLSALAFEQTAVKSFLGALNTAVDTSKQTLIEKVRDMATTPTCCPVLRRAAKGYLSALSVEKTAAKNFLEELEADIVKVVDMVEFAHSPYAADFLGVEDAKKMANHADALKNHGAKYCDCLACEIGLEILNNKKVLLA